MDMPSMTSRLALRKNMKIPYVAFLMSMSFVGTVCHAETDSWPALCGTFVMGAQAYVGSRAGWQKLSLEDRVVGAVMTGVPCVLTAAGMPEAALVGAGASLVMYRIQRHQSPKERGCEQARHSLTTGAYATLAAAAIAGLYAVRNGWGNGLQAMLNEK